MTRLNVVMIAAALGFLAAVAMVLVTTTDAQAAEVVHVLTVDGTEYAPDKVVGSGETVHYFTPGRTPGVAFTERHTWTGHGSENLPCNGRLHWIDNANVLTISHCEETPSTTTTTQPPTTTTTQPPTTTTTQPPTTTTTEPPTTTTTQPPTTTTTEPPTTTTTEPPETTTTQPPETTTTIPPCNDTTTTTPPEPPCGDGTPCGGVQTGGGACADGSCNLATLAANAATSGGGDTLAFWALALGLLALAVAFGLALRARRTEASA